MEERAAEGRSALHRIQALHLHLEIEATSGQRSLINPQRLEIILGGGLKVRINGEDAPVDQQLLDRLVLCPGTSTGFHKGATDAARMMAMVMPG